MNVESPLGEVRARHECYPMGEAFNRDVSGNIYSQPQWLLKDWPHYDLVKRLPDFVRRLLGPWNGCARSDGATCG